MLNKVAPIVTFLAGKFDRGNHECLKHNLKMNPEHHPLSRRISLRSRAFFS